MKRGFVQSLRERRPDAALRRALTTAAVLDVLEGRRLLASVNSLVLINADSDQSLRTGITNGSTVNIDLKATRRVNFRAETSAAGSVRFGYDAQSNYRTESVAPYAFAADNNAGDYYAFTPTVGTHTLSATAFSGSGATGSASSQFKITLKVVDTSTTTSSTSGPYLGGAPSIPSNTVLFANFDYGGEGKAYHDTDAINQKGEYRTGGVDIERNTDSTPSDLQSQQGAGRSVGVVRASEWLKYTVNITSAGMYKLQMRFASGSAGGTAHLEVNGNNVSGPIALTGTGGWQSWRTIEKTGIALPAGTHTLRFVIDSTNGGDVGNLHWFKFSKTTLSPSSLRWPGSWQQGPSAPTARFESFGHQFGGKLYAFGGFKNYDFDVHRTYTVFDPNTNKWTDLGTMPAGVAETHVGGADDGRYIYFVGGFAGDHRHGQNPTQIASKNVWRYEPATNKWTQLTSLPSARGAGGASVINGKLHYFSGNPADRVTNIGEHLVLDLNNMSAGWKNKKAMPDPKDHFSTITIGSKIYVMGGEYGHDERADIQKSVHVYDANTDSWTRLADMPFTNSHSEAGTFLMDGQIVFAGGQYNSAQQSTSRVVAYNPATNKWTELKSLPVKRQGAVMGVFGNKIVLALGAEFTHKPQSGVWIGYR